MISANSGASSWKKTEVSDIAFLTFIPPFTSKTMHTAIIGGGAAGFFLAINLKEMMPEMEVTIFERSRRVLAKVEISGGGRCNCTNTFDDIKDLSAVYPRGHRLLKRLFKSFSHRDAYRWFEAHGVPLTIQDDHCIFPAAQDSHAIINCFLRETNRHQVHVRTQQRVVGIDKTPDGRILVSAQDAISPDTAPIAEAFDFVAVTTGGSPKEEGLRWLARIGHEIAAPVPSLFTFNIEDKALRTLTGTVVEDATAFIPGMKYRSRGSLLITHWGMSGPAILKLSSHGARLLHEKDYHQTVCINWLSRSDTEVTEELQRIAASSQKKQLGNMRPFNDCHQLSAKLWNYLLTKALGQRAFIRWENLQGKEMNRLVNTLCNDSYQLSGRGSYKEEFVTCGGISLASINASTLESRLLPHLFFAGEVLDIDGITGGFNFQAAWTTAHTVARAITAMSKPSFS